MKDKKPGMFHDFYEKLVEGLNDPRPDGFIDVPFREGGGVWMDPDEAKFVKLYLEEREARA